MKVAVIGGGTSSEHAVSLATADGVQQALLSTRHEVVRLDIDRAGQWRDASGIALTPSDAVALMTMCDVLFPLVHGPGGEDGTLAGFAEMVGLPCVGSGVRAGALAMDKWTTKLIATELGIPVAAGTLLRPDSSHQFSGPCVVKPVAAGSSQGVSFVREESEWAPALQAAFAEDDRVLVEDVVAGREIDIAVLRRADGRLLVSPPLEIGVDGFFDYEAKYGGDARFLIPALLSTSQSLSLGGHATRLFEALGCDGVARVDFFLTDNGWLLNEVNTVPGMTPASQVPQMFAAIGLGYEALVNDLVESAATRRSRVTT